ncbi:hypothetical protein SAMN05192574_102387 [Mucilaginibacter gossypiicola]|uniref:Uncharacterized protein n=1 Tax=Mucilaginibacter gossypiicola TaxID=551995 RepID=A0A1H8DKQ0_9SPHI|nr:hypothetical protein [Mucilaginibacter gossypiicola]SEN07891.1 hypothetical protein SAMN05192574_102387 [Mucilaginibacter gossypiicola]
MRAKALILLIVFLLNTVVGFSCAIHMTHRDHGEADAHLSDHALFVTAPHEHTSQELIITANDPCCQGAVNNFVSQAKQVPASNPVLLLAPFVLISKPIDFYLSPVSSLRLSKFQIKDKRRRPPERDIRTTIQSFLI